MKISHFAQRGLSNVQVSIAILITVVALLGAIAGQQYVLQSKISNELSEINDLQNSTVRYGGSLSVFSAANVNAAILAGLNFFPASRISGTVNAPIVANQWGGTITPSVGTATSAGDSIAFTYTGVSDYACKEMGVRSDGIASAISINGVNTKISGVSSNPQAVINACVGNANNNTIVYTISR